MGPSEEDCFFLPLCKLCTLVLYLLCIGLQVLFCLFKHAQETGEDEIPQTYEEYITRKTTQIMSRISFNIRILLRKNRVFYRILYAFSGLATGAAPTPQDDLEDQSCHNTNIPNVGGENQEGTAEDDQDSCGDNPENRNITDTQSSPHTDVAGKIYLQDSNPDPPLPNVYLTKDCQKAKTDVRVNLNTNPSSAEDSSERPNRDIPTVDEEENCTTSTGEFAWTSTGEEQLERSLSPNSSLASIPDSLTATKQEYIKDCEESQKHPEKESKEHPDPDWSSPTIDTDSKASVSGASIALKDFKRKETDNFQDLGQNTQLRPDSRTWIQCHFVESNDKNEYQEDNDVNPVNKIVTDQLISSKSVIEKMMQTEVEDTTLGGQDSDQVNCSNDRLIDIKRSKSKGGIEGKGFVSPASTSLLTEDSEDSCARNKPKLVLKQEKSPQHDQCKGEQKEDNTDLSTSLNKDEPESIHLGNHSALKPFFKESAVTGLDIQITDYTLSDKSSIDKHLTTQPEASGSSRSSDTKIADSVQDADDGSAIEEISTFITSEPNQSLELNPELHDEEMGSHGGGESVPRVQESSHTSGVKTLAVDILFQNEITKPDVSSSDVKSDTHLITERFTNHDPRSRDHDQLDTPNCTLDPNETDQPTGIDMTKETK